MGPKKRANEVLEKKKFTISTVQCSLFIEQNDKVVKKKREK